MGAVGSQLIVDLCKYTVGRLRPHFFNVCQPIFDDNLCEPPNSTSPAVVYVVNYTCSGNRQVFPVWTLRCEGINSNFFEKGCYAVLRLLIQLHHF